MASFGTAPLLWLWTSTRSNLNSGAAWGGGHLSISICISGLPHPRPRHIRNQSISTRKLGQQKSLAHSPSARVGGYRGSLYKTELWDCATYSETTVVVKSNESQSGRKALGQCWAGEGRETMFHASYVDGLESAWSSVAAIVWCVASTYLQKQLGNTTRLKSREQRLRN